MNQKSKPNRHAMLVNNAVSTLEVVSEEDEEEQPTNMETRIIMFDEKQDGVESKDLGDRPMLDLVT